jgi:hypothetical protein
MAVWWQYNWCDMIWSSHIEASTGLERHLISHICLTLDHLLRGDLAPVCNQWGISLTIEHILQECPCYYKECQTFHLIGTLCNILDVSCNVSNMVAFLHGIGVDKFIYLTLFYSPMWAVSLHCYLTVLLRFFNTIFIFVLLLFLPSVGPLYSLTHTYFCLNLVSAEEHCGMAVLDFVMLYSHCSLEVEDSVRQSLVSSKTFYWISVSVEGSYLRHLTNWRNSVSTFCVFLKAVWSSCG